MSSPVSEQPSYDKCGANWLAHIHHCSSSPFGFRFETENSYNCFPLVKRESEKEKERKRERERGKRERARICKREREGTHTPTTKFGTPFNIGNRLKQPKSTVNQTSQINFQFPDSKRWRKKNSLMNHSERTKDKIVFLQS